MPGKTLQLSVRRRSLGYREEIISYLIEIIHPVYLPVFEGGRHHLSLYLVYRSQHVILLHIENTVDSTQSIKSGQFPIISEKGHPFS